MDGLIGPLERYFARRECARPVRLVSCPDGRHDLASWG